MQHRDHDTFLTAIAGLTIVLLAFTSQDDGGAELTRTCAPLDYGPRARAKDPVPCYHLWDYDSDSPSGPHVLSLPPRQVVTITATGATFDPAEFITWETRWHHPRDWGAYS